ncbi:MAG: PLDc N-terminal domain-containing protein [Candidatus Tyrphobacter sp.]
MKLLFEILISVFLHPVAVILALINLLTRTDLESLKKVVWAILIIFAWGLGPILYILLTDGGLW